jgi:hypothetical protein
VAELLFFSQSTSAFAPRPASGSHKSSVVEGKKSCKSTEKLKDRITPHVNLFQQAAKEM